MKIFPMFIIAALIFIALSMLIETPEDRLKLQLLDRGLVLGDCARLRQTKVEGTLIQGEGYGYISFMHKNGTTVHHHLIDLEPCGG